MSSGSYRKHNDRSQNSSTYHKKDGTAVRAKLAREAREEIEEGRNERRLAIGIRARETLQRLGIDPAIDFHALPRSRVAALLEEAKLQKYRRPQSANGSKARYFHAKLMREAGRVLFTSGRWV